MFHSFTLWYYNFDRWLHNRNKRIKNEYLFKILQKAYETKLLFRLIIYASNLKETITIYFMKVIRKLTLTWISRNQICLDTIRIEIVFLWWTMRCRCTLWRRKLDVLGFHICLMSIQEFGLKLLLWYFLWEVLSCLDVFWCRRKQ